MGHKHSWAQGTGQPNDWPRTQWEMAERGRETNQRLRDAQFGARASAPMQAAGCFIVAIAGILILAILAVMVWAAFGG